MFELINLRGNTYCYTMPTNVGFYVCDDGGVYIIDTGVNDRSAKRIMTMVSDNGWHIKAVILTHAHTDHAGGCRYLAENSGCTAYATEAERVFVKYPDMEPAMVYGAFPCRDFRGMFMNTPAWDVKDIASLELPDGFEIISLPGHFVGMIGVRTPDDVYFLADSVIARETLEKSPMSYIFDVESQYATLEMLKTFEGKLCVPSHAAPTEKIGELAQFNKASLDKVNDTLLSLMQSPVTVEEMVKAVSKQWNLSDSFMQYVLTCSGVRTHLTCLRHRGLIEHEIKDGEMRWSVSKQG